MVGRSARFMAPVALAAVTLGVVLIVHSGLNARAPTVHHSGTAIVNGTRRSTSGRRGPRFYVVKPGDTLSAIAGRTGVSMTQLTGLNPSLASSPNNLQTGQRLRLRR